MKEHGNHKERLISLRNELGKTRALGTFNNDLYDQQMTQLLNTYEGQKMKCDQEIARLSDQMAVLKGQKRALDRASDQLIEIVSAYNRQNVAALAEEKRVLDEREEVAAEQAKSNSKKRTRRARSLGASKRA